MDFNKSGTFKGKFQGEKVYSFEGQYNDATKQIDLIIDFDGQKYNGNADFDFDGTTGLIKFNFDLGPAGKFNFEANGVKDLSKASVRFLLNNKDIFSAKLKGDLKNAPRQFLYEARWTGVF